MKHCNQCGKSLDDTDAFCSSCGAKIDMIISEKETIPPIEQDKIFQSTNSTLGAQVKKEKKRQGCLTIFLWIFFLPVMLIIAIANSKTLNVIKKTIYISIVSIICIFFMVAPSLETAKNAEQAFSSIEIAIDNNKYFEAQKAIYQFNRDYPKSKYTNAVEMMGKSVDIEVEKIYAAQAFSSIEIAIDNNDYLEAQKKIYQFISDYPNSEYIDEVELMKKSVDIEAESIRIEQLISSVKIAVDNNDYIEAQKEINHFLNDFPNSKYIDDVETMQKTVDSEAEKFKIAQENENTLKRIEEEKLVAEKAAIEAKKAEEAKSSFINSCKTISYKQISRNPDNYKGQTFKFTGKVIQAMEPTFGDTVNLRINVTKDSYGYWSDTVYAQVIVPKGDDRILEDDIITFYGYCDGLYSYKTVLGATVSLPKFTIKYFNINL